MLLFEKITVAARSYRAWCALFSCYEGVSNGFARTYQSLHKGTQTMQPNCEFSIVSYSMLLGNIFVTWALSRLIF